MYTYVERGRWGGEGGRERERKDGHRTTKTKSEIRELMFIICVYMHECVYAYICTHVYVRICVRIYTCVCMYEYLYVYRTNVYIRMYVHIYTSISMYGHIHGHLDAYTHPYIRRKKWKEERKMCIYISMYACKYVYTHVYGRIHAQIYAQEKWKEEREMSEKKIESLEQQLSAALAALPYTVMSPAAVTSPLVSGLSVCVCVRERERERD